MYHYQNIVMDKELSYKEKYGRHAGFFIWRDAMKTFKNPDFWIRFCIFLLAVYFFITNHGIWKMVCFVVIIISALSILTMSLKE